MWERGKERSLALALLAGAFEGTETGTDTVLARKELWVLLGPRRRLEELRLLSRDRASIRSDSTLKEELVR